MSTLEEKLVAKKELTTRMLEQKYAAERSSLHTFLKTYRKEERNNELDDNRHIQLICEKLEEVYK